MYAIKYSRMQPFMRIIIGLAKLHVASELNKHACRLYDHEWCGKSLQISDD